MLGNRIRRRRIGQSARAVVQPQLADHPGRTIKIPVRGEHQEVAILGQRPRARAVDVKIPCQSLGFHEGRRRIAKPGRIDRARRLEAVVENEDGGNEDGVAGDGVDGDGGPIKIRGDLEGLDKTLAGRKSEGRGLGVEFVVPRFVGLQGLVADLVEAVATDLGGPQRLQAFSRVLGNAGVDGGTRFHGGEP